MRAWLAWSTGAALIAAAWGIALITPSEAAPEEPFPVAVQIGEAGMGRDLAVTVVDVRRAEAARTDEWSAAGNWVVVDLDAAAVLSEYGNSLALVTLETGGRTFRASERPESLLGHALSVGAPLSGSVAFELPDEAAGGPAVLTFGVSTDPRLDSLIVLEIDLDDIALDGEAELIPVDWSTR
ncbi:hypothetical protein [Microbacterium terregens]|uniref:DUF4352 domain-containing protein n=1 Tax=Microbacterium terregens TaxID=69363 RepID=A0ABV5SX85_9MICO